MMSDISVESNELAKQVMDYAFTIHREMGAGLLESVYETCFCYLLHENELSFERQKQIPVTFQGINIDAGFRADIIIENQLLLELKAVDRLQPTHEAQILNYLRLSGIELGFLINFNEKLLKDGLKRYVQSKSV